MTKPLDHNALIPTRGDMRRATSTAAFRIEDVDEDDPLLDFEPYLHTAPRRNSITPDRQRRFIAHLAATGIVKLAALHIGASLEALYRLRAMPGAEGFAEAWEDALQRGSARLEDIALERSMLGTPTPIVGRDGLLGWWNKPDNVLLRFMLQHRLPERYGPEEAIGRGHPVYARIRREILEEIEAEQERDRRHREELDAIFAEQEEAERRGLVWKGYPVDEDDYAEDEDVDYDGDEDYDADDDESEDYRED